MKKSKIKLKHQPEPNIATIVTEKVGEDLRVMYESKDSKSKVEIFFRSVEEFKFGSPNDEGFHVFYKDIFDYPKLGFELNNLYLVENLDNKFGNKFEKKLQSDSSLYHYIFFVKEGTFQCLARSIEV